MDGISSTFIQLRHFYPIKSATMIWMIDKKTEISLAKFTKLGGKINDYYLRQDRPSRGVLVNLNGWFSGKTVNEAITKAILGQKVVTTGSAASR